MRIRHIWKSMVNTSRFGVVCGIDGVQSGLRLLGIREYTQVHGLQLRKLGDKRLDATGRCLDVVEPNLFVHGNIKTGFFCRVPIAWVHKNTNHYTYRFLCLHRTYQLLLAKRLFSTNLLNVNVLPVTVPRMVHSFPLVGKVFFRVYLFFNILVGAIHRCICMNPCLSTLNVSFMMMNRKPTSIKTGIFIQYVHSITPRCKT
mmetsp:Transcript_32889/g.52447  ORF Transcript_32889/g.52447 Transcript_32889/m.52447 type:complete len:201 (-) Transcript_32889:1622-2224(-)